MQLINLQNLFRLIWQNMDKHVPFDFAFYTWQTEEKYIYQNQFILIWPAFQQFVGGGLTLWYTQHDCGSQNEFSN
jgi:hypothetical protein